MVKVGARVKRPDLGSGTVTSVDDRYIVIDFDAHGRKVFVASMVVLEPSNEPAPARSATPAKSRKKSTKAQA